MISFKIAWNIGYQVACVCLLMQVPQDVIPMEPYKLFALCTMISMVAGMGSMARQKELEITPRIIASHALNMGTLGASASMLLYAVLHPRSNLEWLILGVVGAFSLGGMTSIEWITERAQSLLAKFTGGESND